MKRLKEIKQLLEAADLYVKIDRIDNKEYLVVKRKATSKKDLCEILFNKKGEVEHIVLGSAPDRTAWINVSSKRTSSKKNKRQQNTLTNKLESKHAKKGSGNAVPERIFSWRC